MVGALTFNDDGTVGAIYSDEIAGYLEDLSPDGQVEIKRASDVEPVDGGGWRASIRPWVPGGAVDLPATATRAESLAQEVTYLDGAL